MTGAELKTFAKTVHDDAIIEVREGTYGRFQSTFVLRSVLVCTHELRQESSDT